MYRHICAAPGSSISSMTVWLTCPLLLVIGLVPAVSWADDAPDEAGLILKSMPLPVAAVGDLAWDGSELWISDWEGGELIRFDPATGKVLRRVAAPCYRPRGLAWGAGKLYVLDDSEGMIYVYEPESGIAVAAYRSPTGTGLGLAWDGEALWLADHGEKTLQKLIPDDGTTLTYFPAPEIEPGGLAFDGTYLWVTERRHDRIFMVDPSTGSVITGFASPGPYPCGLAPAPEGRLWAADFEDGLLRLCAPREARAFQTEDWRETELRMTYRIENQGPGVVRDAVIHFAVPPAKLENQVLSGELTYNPTQPLISADQWGQGIATFRRDRIRPGECFEVGYSAHARIADLNYILFPERTGSLDDIPPGIREAYTVDGERFQVNSDLVQKTAAEIVNGEENPYWIARKIYDWVIEALEYERVGGWDVPETLIKRGTGSCSEYTFLYIGLCRAAGLPARYEAGTAVRHDDASVDDVHHRWAEVYLPTYGWIPVDPSRGDQATPGGQADAIGRLSNRLFVTTHSGGGSQALAWTYNARATYSRGGRCSVTEDEWVVTRRAKEEGEAITPSRALEKP